MLKLFLTSMHWTCKFKQNACAARKHPIAPCSLLCLFFWLPHHLLHFLSVPIPHKEGTALRRNVRSWASFSGTYIDSCTHEGGVGGHCVPAVYACHVCLPCVPAVVASAPKHTLHICCKCP